MVTLINYNFLTTYSAQRLLDVILFSPQGFDKTFLCFLSGTLLVILSFSLDFLDAKKTDLHICNSGNQSSEENSVCTAVHCSDRYA